MVHDVLTWITRVILRARLHHALVNLCDLAAQHDIVAYESDEEIGHEVNRKIKRYRRRATVFGGALQNLSQPPKG
jgi:hypothetical protein